MKSTCDPCKLALSELGGMGNRKLSQSLTNLPKVMLTEPGNKKHLLDNFEEFKTRSQPCSPSTKRRAFTTCIAGTRYVIGKS